MRVKTVILIVAVLIGIGIYAPNSIFAEASSSWDQTIELSVPLRDKLVDFILNGSVSGDGSAANPYQTYTSDISLSITVAGAGEVVVTDAARNVIYTYTKTSSGTETFTFTNVLSNGVGSYELTATFTDLSDSNNIYDSKSIFLSYLTTPIILNPASPSTGVMYLGNRAFLVQDLSIIAVFSALIVTTVAITVRKKTRRK